MTITIINERKEFEFNQNDLLDDQYSDFLDSLTNDQFNFFLKYQDLRLKRERSTVKADIMEKLSEL